MGGMFGKPASEYEVFSKPLTPGDGPPASALVIVNPYGGGGRGPRTLDQVQPILESAGIALEVAITARAGHAIELARDATHPCVIVIGGDGTLHEAIQGLMARPAGSPGVTFGIIPSGSGNTVAWDMRISSVAEAAAAIVGGATRRIDLAELSADALELPSIEGGGGSDTRPAEKASPNAVTAVLEGPRGYGDKIYSINIVGWGLPATVLRSAEELRCCGGPAQYNLAAYRSLIANRAYHASVSFEEGYANPYAGSTHDDDSYIMVQSQTTVHMGDKMPFCPRAKLDDGLLDLVMIRHTSRCGLVGIMENAKVAKHTEGPQVEYHQVASYTLHPTKADSGPLSVNVDGELVGFSPCRVTCIPGAIEVYSAW